LYVPNSLGIHSRREFPASGGFHLVQPQFLSIASISRAVKFTPPLPNAALSAQLKCHLPFQTTSYPAFSLSSEATFGWRS
jgi:hypothetical protein